MGKWVVRPTGSWAQGPLLPACQGDANPQPGRDAEAANLWGSQVGKLQPPEPAQQWDGQSEKPPPWISARCTDRFSRSASCTPGYPSLAFSLPGSAQRGSGSRAEPRHPPSLLRASCANSRDCSLESDTDAPTTGLILQCILDLSKKQERRTHSILAWEKGMNH